jgi:hypothetical protein
MNGDGQGLVSDTPGFATGRSPASTNWSNFSSQATAHLPRMGSEVQSPGEAYRSQMNATEPMPYGPDQMENVGSRAAQY